MPICVQISCSSENIDIFKILLLCFQFVSLFSVKKQYIILRKKCGTSCPCLASKEEQSVGTVEFYVTLSGPSQRSENPGGHNLPLWLISLHKMKIEFMGISSCLHSTQPKWPNRIYSLDFCRSVYSSSNLFFLTCICSKLSMLESFYTGRAKQSDC